jgi:hypothetical protein
MATQVKLNIMDINLNGQPLAIREKSLGELIDSAAQASHRAYSMSCPDDEYHLRDSEALQAGDEVVKYIKEYHNLTAAQLNHLRQIIN